MVTVYYLDLVYTVPRTRKSKSEHERECDIDDSILHVLRTPYLILQHDSQERDKGQVKSMYLPCYSYIPHVFTGTQVVK